MYVYHYTLAFKVDILQEHRSTSNSGCPFSRILMVFSQNLNARPFDRRPATTITTQRQIFIKTTETAIRRSSSNNSQIQLHFFVVHSPLFFFPLNIFVSLMVRKIVVTSCQQPGDFVGGFVGKLLLALKQ